MYQATGRGIHMHGQSIKSWRLLFKMKLPHLKVNVISYTTCKIILLISINETQLVEEMSDVDSLLLFDHWKSDIFIVQWIILVIFAPLSTVTSTYLRRHTNINHTNINHTVLFCLELPVFCSPWAKTKHLNGFTHPPSTGTFQPDLDLIFRPRSYW